MNKEDRVNQIMRDLNEFAPRRLAISPKELAEFTGLSKSGLDNYRKEGLGPRWKKLGTGRCSRVLYPKNAVAEWLADTVETA